MFSVLIQSFAPIFISIFAAAAFSIPISMQFGLGGAFVQNPESGLLKRLFSATLAGASIPFWLIFALGLSFAAAGMFSALLIAAIGAGGKIIFAPIFSENPRRMVFLGALAIISAWCVYDLHYLLPIMVLALYASFTAAKRIEKSGVFNIMSDNYSFHEVRYARFVASREYIAPFFILFMGATMIGGYFAKVWPTFLVGSTGIQTPLYNSPVLFSLTCVIWSVGVAMILSALHSFLAYFSLGATMGTTIDLANGRASNKTIRGAAKSKDLQSQLDQK